jgi:ubiquinone/menaquinone biosynthesis C-methylase UbiE
MTSNSAIERHYAQAAVIAAITRGLAALGKSPSSVTLDDLAPVEEFHIGGRPATEELMRQVGPLGDWHVLDVGSGIGGPARFIADRYGCRVSGVDLTADYVETARTINAWVGLADRVDFRHASALATPFADATFDMAYMLHVGMNIADKPALCAEVARVLKAGGAFAIYDVMKTGSAPLTFPLPWASAPEISAVAPPEGYKGALRAAGFTVLAERNRRDFAIEFFKTMRSRLAQAGGPPPLGLHIVMGNDAGTKIANLVAGLEAGAVAPVEIIARRG